MTELFSGIAARPESRALSAGLWARRVVMTLLAAVTVLALTGIAGQSGSTETAAGPAASLAVGMPTAVRGGLFFQAKVEVRATRAIEHPRLVLASGWLEGLQVNSVEPAAQSEASRDGRLVLSYDSLAAGDRLVVYLQFQVDPTDPGRRDTSLELDDADRPLARVDRHLTVLP